MANSLSAAESIRRLAVQYQDMVAAADALEAIGSIEQATQEAVKARKVAEDARDAARAELVAAKAKVKEAEDAARAVAADAAARSDKTKAIAVEEAAAIVREAQVKAEQIIGDAAIKANDVAAQFDSQVNELQAKLEGLKAEAASALAARDEAVEQAEKAQKKLDSVQATIKKLAGV